MITVSKEDYLKAIAEAGDHQLALPGVDRNPRFGTVDWRAAGPTDPPCPYPGNERRELPPETEQTQTRFNPGLLIQSPPVASNAAGRMASSATLQTPSSPHS